MAGSSPAMTERVRRSNTKTVGIMRIGWTIKRQSGSHRTLSHPGRPDYVFAFHDGEEIGPRMLARIAKHTGSQPGDL